MFLPSKTASFISLTLGMSYLSFSPPRLRGGVAAKLTGWCGCPPPPPACGGPLLLTGGGEKYTQSSSVYVPSGYVPSGHRPYTSSSEIDFEVAVGVHLERTPRMHNDGGVGRLDHRRPLDRVAGNEEGAVVDRRRHRLFQVAPIDASLAAVGFRIDFRRELFRPRKLRPRRCCGGAQAQGHDLQARLAVGRAAAVELFVTRVETLMQRLPERIPDALLRQHHLDLV